MRPTPDDRRQVLKRALVLVGIWLVPGLLQCVQELTYATSHGAAEVPLGRVLAHFLPTWLPWAGFTPCILWLSRRAPLQRGDLTHALPLHLIACLAFGATHLLLLGVVRTQWPPGPWAQTELGPWLANSLWSLHAQVEVLAYAGVVLAGHVLTAQRSARQRELAALALEGQLSDARLQALRAQLQPHFLFNALNSIDVLMTEDRPRAGAMLHRLSDLLRHTLAQDRPQHTLEAELEHLRCYLEIEQVRFSDRLTVEYDITDDVQGALVPSLLLQPLVENAIRHGIAPSARGGRLRITAQRDDGQLQITIEDDGLGMPTGMVEGIGLSNTRERLAAIHGDAHEIEIASPKLGGVRVSIRLPLASASPRDSRATSATS